MNIIVKKPIIYLMGFSLVMSIILGNWIAFCGWLVAIVEWIIIVKKIDIYKGKI